MLCNRYCCPTIVSISSRVREPLILRRWNNDGISLSPVAWDGHVANEVMKATWTKAVCAVS